MEVQPNSSMQEEELHLALMNLQNFAALQNAGEPMGASIKMEVSSSQMDVESEQLTNSDLSLQYTAILNQLSYPQLQTQQFHLQQAQLQQAQLQQAQLQQAQIQQLF